MSAKPSQMKGEHLENDEQIHVITYQISDAAMFKLAAFLSRNSYAALVQRLFGFQFILSYKSNELKFQWYDGGIHRILPFMLAFMTQFLDNFVGPTKNILHKKTCQQTLLALSNANNFKLPQNFRCVSRERKNRCKSFFYQTNFQFIVLFQYKTKPKKKPTRKKPLSKYT